MIKGEECTMDTEPTVVVVLKPMFERYGKHALWAARFQDMGLTAYGMTQEQALDNLKHMFHLRIQALRRRGLVAAELSRLKARWSWERDYPEDWIPYEHANEPAGEPLVA
jgi:hypothetical protein